ncbi:YxlC family protein [Bacillus sp. FJAT-45350]|uniref:YxlC family protein n=1 Tax=Bacillus sp. FJAT-45350 TaxID=2011014 RepID=UPI000BB8D576|nr:YxlC family protein [Bacillus sp. FJAT-45350]
MRRNDEENINQLKRDWKQFDDLGEEYVSMVEIKDQLNLYHEKKKRTFYKELVIFLCSAFVILSAFTLSYLRAPGLFIAIQVGASVLAPLFLFVLAKRNNRKGKVLL